MLNICGSCEHKRIRWNDKCDNCSGNPKLVDNFKQTKRLPPIKRLPPNVKGERDERDMRKKL